MGTTTKTMVEKLVTSQQIKKKKPARVAQKQREREEWEKNEKYTRRPETI